MKFISEGPYRGAELCAPEPALDIARYIGPEDDCPKCGSSYAHRSSRVRYESDHVQMDYEDCDEDECDVEVEHIHGRCPKCKQGFVCEPAHLRRDERARLRFEHWMGVGAALLLGLFFGFLLGVSVAGS